MVLPQCRQISVAGAAGCGSAGWGSAGEASGAPGSVSGTGAGSGGREVSCDSGTVAGISLPQWLQNFAPVRTVLPQFGHVTDILTSCGQLNGPVDFTSGPSQHSRIVLIVQINRITFNLLYFLVLYPVDNYP
jgi:hypothetical protein